MCKTMLQQINQCVYILQEVNNKVMYKRNTVMTQLSKLKFVVIEMRTGNFVV